MNRLSKTRQNSRNVSPLPKLDIKLDSNWIQPSVYPTMKAKDFNLGLELKNNILSFQSLYRNNFEQFSHAPERRKPVNSQLAPQKALEFPFSAIVSIETIYPDDSYVSSSGFMVGSRYVLTAAHNIKSGDIQATCIYVCPGRNHNDFPFGIHQVSYAFLAYKGESNMDIALLVIKEEIGLAAGWFGMLDFNDCDLLSTVADSKEKSIADRTYGSDPKAITVTGFTSPQVKKLSGRALIVPQHLVTHTNKSGLKDLESFPKKFQTEDFLVYDIETSESQSGSPVWIKDGNGFLAIGLHLNTNQNPRCGLGLKLNMEKIKMIKNWMSRDFFLMNQKVRDFTLVKRRRQTYIKTEPTEDEREDKSNNNVEINFDRHTEDEKEMKNAIEELLEIKGIKGLILNFIACEKLTNKGLKILAKALQHLKTLERIKINFTLPRLVTEIGYREFNKGLSLITSLKSVEFNFSYCPKLSDDGFKDLSLSFQSLKNLNSLILYVIGCPLVTSASRLILFQNLSGRLRRLRVLKIKVLD